MGNNGDMLTIDLLFNSSASFKKKLLTLKIGLRKAAPP